MEKTSVFCGRPGGCAGADRVVLLRFEIIRARCGVLANEFFVGSPFLLALGSGGLFYLVFDFYFLARAVLLPLVMELLTQLGSLRADIIFTGTNFLPLRCGEFSLVNYDAVAGVCTAPSAHSFSRRAE